MAETEEAAPPPERRTRAKKAPEPPPVEAPPEPFDHDQWRRVQALQEAYDRMPEAAPEALLDVADWILTGQRSKSFIDLGGSDDGPVLTFTNPTPNPIHGKASA